MTQTLRSGAINSRARTVFGSRLGNRSVDRNAAMTLNDACVMLVVTPIGNSPEKKRRFRLFSEGLGA